MEPYNARAQVGLLISQRSKQKLREGNGGPEDTPYGPGQEHGLERKATNFRQGSSLHSILSRLY